MLEETLTRAKILIVDDQESNVRLLERLLQQAGYTTLQSTTDSRLVLPLFTEFRPDLILLDLMMPHLDGFAVMQALKVHIPAEDYLPILVLTADMSPDAKRQALQGGATDSATENYCFGNGVKVKTRGKSSRLLLVTIVAGKPCMLKCHVNQRPRAARPMLEGRQNR